MLERNRIKKLIQDKIKNKGKVHLNKEDFNALIKARKEKKIA